ncbi:hypothetical protein F9288_08930 [Sphingomonas sp. CL5.1]|uniref:hypothetical protein n=1 Tax=Sphingomonas sp. CL5.1 TaxID=2653203 RepID=UPI00158157A6|nr:hypothetical protein [Sphingomonas sp. CL5.1]QKR99747.1 hypothetical protein F9288_08930 [Sphingomonas sp. CL5.1]
MYKISENNVPVFLIGRDLIQVGLGLNDVVMNFDNNCSMTIMSIDRFSVENKDLLESVVSFDGKYIGKAVKKVTIGDQSTFFLTFDGGGVVTVADDSEDYESVILRHGSRTYSI